MKLPIWTRKRLLGVITISVATFAGSLVAIPTAGANPTGPPPAESPSGSADPNIKIRASLDYLMTTFKVDEPEALRRLRLQSQADSIAQKVRTTVADHLLAVWLDQKNGGRLTFLTDMPTEASNSVRGYPEFSQMAFVRSAHTLAELNRAEAQAKLDLAGVPDARIGLDRRNEAVVVEYSGTDAMRKAKVDRLATVTAAGSVPIIVDTTPTASKNSGDQKSCDIFACDPPMRGGLRLHVRRDDNSWGSCTSAFNVRGSNGALYLMTAGHCVIVPGPKRQFMYHNGLPVAVEVNQSGSYTDPNAPADTRFFNNNFPHTDWSLLPYQVTGSTLWHQYWVTGRGSHNLVQAQCASPSNHACNSGTYSVVGSYRYDQLQVGWVVCATGTGASDVYSNDAGYIAGTHCGSIQDTDMDTYYSSKPWGWGIKVDICSRDGDSGGPLFNEVDHFAYGILSGGPKRDDGADPYGPCDLSKPWEYSVYSSISEDLNQASSQTGITMSLVTTANG